MSKYRNLDLNELKTELRNAYQKKCLEVQIREKEVETKIENIRENYRANLEKLKNLNQDESARLSNVESKRKRQIYKKELEIQMRDKERKKKMDDDKAREERLLLVESDRILDENIVVEKTLTKKILAERLQRERKIFLEIKAVRKRMAMEAEKMEKMRNEKYAEEAERRKRELDEIRVEQNKRRNELIERVAKTLINFDTKKLETQTKIEEMAAEEIAWEIVIQEREEELRGKMMREKLSKGLRKQIFDKEERTRLTLERDRNFAEMVMRQVMEDEKIEKLTNEAKTRSRIVYGKDLIRMMEDRRRIRKLEEERIIMEFEREKEMEELQKKEILEARRQLITEHARNVASYVGNDFLTDEEKIIVAEALKK